MFAFPRRSRELRIPIDETSFFVRISDDIVGAIWRKRDHLLHFRPEMAFETDPMEKTNIFG